MSRHTLAIPYCLNSKKTRCLVVFIRFSGVQNHKQVSPTRFPCFHGPWPDTAFCGTHPSEVAHESQKWESAQILNSCIFWHRNDPILLPAMQVAVTASGEGKDKQTQKAAPPLPPTVLQQKSSWTEGRRSQLNSPSVLFPSSGNNLFA